MRNDRGNPSLNFCDQFDEWMGAYGEGLGYQKYKFWDDGYIDVCQVDRNKSDKAHPGVFLERYRKFENEPNNPQNGLDDNENATIVIFSGFSGSPYPSRYIWAYYLGGQDYFMLEPRESPYPPCFEVDTDGDGINDETRCRHFFINPTPDFTRELVKMGCSSTTQEGCIPGSGETRWLILNSCHGFDLPSGNHPLLRILKTWDRANLNGGYRAILGFSGPVHCASSAASVAPFLDDVLFIGKPLYWSWLTWMDGYADKYGVTDTELEWTSKCVMLAKGNSPVDATNNLRLDTFRMYEDVPPVQPDEHGNWYTALAIRDCAVQPPKRGSHYHYEVGLHKIDIHMPDVATAKIYPVDNSTPSELSMKIQSFFLALLFGFSLSDALDAFSSPLESDENAGVITIAEQAKYVYYYKSGFWEFVNVEALSESEKSSTFEFTEKKRDDISEIGPIGYVEIHIRLEEWKPPRPPYLSPLQS